MSKKDNFQQAVGLINKSKNILITTHTRPDGDSCGCAAAMAEALNNIGKSVEILMLSEVPKWYRFLFQQKPNVMGSDITAEQLKGEQFDLIIIVDTNSNSQLPVFSEILKQNKIPVLVIDHHVTSDNLGDVELVDSSAAAAGLVMWDLIKYAKWPVTKKIAEAIFVAVSTDTGWFHFCNTDSRTFECCSELIEFGVKPAELYKGIYQDFTQQRFKLLTAMLNSLELHFDGRFAVQVLKKADFEKCGAAYSDTENLIDECQRLATVEVAALFVELADGKIKCSLRSRGGVDVGKIAQGFGGGGHKMAAGTYVPTPLESAKQTIKTEIEKQL